MRCDARNAPRRPWDLRLRRAGGPPRRFATRCFVVRQLLLLVALIAGCRATEGFSCGEPGQPCCALGACSAGACCDRDIGFHPPSTSGRALPAVCVAVGSPCAHSNGKTCAGGSCGGCGALGEACCTVSPALGEACSAPASTCVDHRCVSCGSKGAPCCGAECAEGLGCASGRCGDCGGPGQACCAGGACREGLCTFGNVCATACGADGQRCCGPAGSCVDGLLCDGDRCTRCGRPGAPCCDANTCDDGGCCDWSVGRAPYSRCVARGSACGKSQGTCSDGGCSAGPCGTLGAPCCGGGVNCTAPFTACGDGVRCTACGHAGEACCEMQTCGAGLSCKAFVCSST